MNPLRVQGRWAQPIPKEMEVIPAIYHCSIQIIGRSQGRSAVGAAAYRSGEKILNEWDGVTHDYTNKGGVIHKEILLPSHAPPEYSERAVLWNAVEQIEKNKHAQLAREINVIFFAELQRGAQVDLVCVCLWQMKKIQGVKSTCTMCTKRPNSVHKYTWYTYFHVR